MPLVRIDMIAGRAAADVAAISQAVHQAMVECLNVPRRDRFQVITEHAPGRLVFNPAYLEVPRTEGIVLIQVFLSGGRDEAQKRAFYARAAQLLTEGAGMRPEDVTIALAENTRADWSFGNGRAQYLEMPKEQWR
ncbi:MAG: tautomerase family protein [Betaproteobacteria bacterium]|nr:tautomerase family protein [Betaproteobacteria bacterium]